MAITKYSSLLGSLALLALTACASPQRQDREAAAGAVPKNPHQNPANPNPDALPKGLIEWVDYVCSIPDPEARKQAIKDSEEQRGWTFTCPEDKPSQAR
jgi:hypothetical protein